MLKKFTCLLEFRISNTGGVKHIKPFNEVINRFQNDFVGFIIRLVFEPSSI